MCDCDVNTTHMLDSERLFARGGMQHNILPVDARRGRYHTWPSGQRDLGRWDLDVYLSNSGA